MKRWLAIAIAVAGFGPGLWAEPAGYTRVRVLKQNCNLRARPLVNSEVVGQASSNDVLTAKTMSQEWVEVVPPDGVDLWVLGDYVKDGEIVCSQKVNVRAGAGINFNIVGQLSGGEKVEVRGAHAEWVKIAPPPVCSLWIFRALVSDVPPAFIEPAKVDQAQAEPPVPAASKPPAVASAPPPKPAPAVSPPPPSRDEMLRSGAVVGAPAVAAPPDQGGVFFPPPGLDLLPTAGQGRWREVDGILRAKDFIFRAPSDFRLVTSGDGGRNSATICFVKGNQAQLKALLYRHMIVSGREYWVKRQKYPVIVPEQIVIKQ